MAAMEVMVARSGICVEMGGLAAALPLCFYVAGCGKCRGVLSGRREVGFMQLQLRLHRA